MQAAPGALPGQELLPAPDQTVPSWWAQRSQSQLAFGPPWCSTHSRSTDQDRGTTEDGPWAASERKVALGRAGLE